MSHHLYAPTWVTSPRYRAQRCESVSDDNINYCNSVCFPDVGLIARFSFLCNLCSSPCSYGAVNSFKVSEIFFFDYWILQIDKHSLYNNTSLQSNLQYESDMLLDLVEETCTELGFVFLVGHELLLMRFQLNSIINALISHYLSL